MGILGRVSARFQRRRPRAHIAGIAGAVLVLAGLGAPAPIASSSIGSPTPSSPVLPGPPEAGFVTPPSGALISGIHDIRAVARDDTGVVIPGEFAYANPATPPGRFGKPIPSPDSPGTSAPGEEVTLTAAFDTRQLPDAEYRIAARITDTEANATTITTTVRTDNTAPRVVMTAPHAGTPAHVTGTYQVSGHVDDANLAAWSLSASAPGWSAEITSGVAPIPQGVIGTFDGHMAPPGYVGAVEVTLVATDSASPANSSSVSGQIFSDYYLDAYGVLDLASSYEISSTIPVKASVTGELGTWRLDVSRAGETDPLITRVGTTTGEALHIADFDVATTYGPGNYVFTLTVTDTDGDIGVDRREVTFIWRPAYLAITYVGPPITGPGPTTPLSEFTDPTISGIVEVRGRVSGSNTWAWALGRPIAIGEPSFAGDKIVFSSNIDDPHNFDIYQLDLDGTDLIRLTNHPGFDYAPKFSGDGAQIVFSSTRDYPTGPGAGTDIYVMGGSGTNIERLTTDGQSTYPAFSPSATHVAFQRPGGIFEIEVSTGAVEQLTSGEDYFPAYSPDGTRLIFDRGTRGAQQVHVADLSTPGYPTSQLVSAPTYSGYPQYSPDGDRIVYVADDVIQIANADGTGAAGLGVTGLDPTFTPDGARIAYATLPAAGPTKIYLIGSDPQAPGMPEELVIPGSSRVPDASSPQLPFPPVPAANAGGYTAIDIASFVKTPDPLTYWGYLRAPPDQLPTGEMATDSILGYIDADRLPPGVTSLSLTALQCPTAPPTFDYGLEIPPDAETLTTTAAIATCHAYSTPQIPLRVFPKTATTELSIDVVRDTPGYSGALSAPRSFAATGSWAAGDAWVFSAPGYDGMAVPLTTRQAGRRFASGPPATDGSDFLPVGDLAALEDLDLVIGDPALGLQTLAGTPEPPVPVACDESFAPGRIGCRYEVDVLPGHFGGATHVRAYSDEPTGLLGAIEWSYSTTAPGTYAPLPSAGGWETPAPPTQTTSVRIIFSGYGRDVALPVPELGSGP